ncbi:DNA (cytosine-5-)-methyltransferase [Lentisphaerota bacterium WC36G]|nr:DNA cytosine methyltransferase [Lentisphaerae bacterium WC36]
MNILSLFDGMSCGRIAPERLGIKVTNYFASEIDKYAIKVSKSNYSDIEHLGDVTAWHFWDLPKIDLIIGGSPCQGFSFAGKQLNFKDPRSKLFFWFVDILEYYKPKYFMLENVKMKKEYQDIITSYLGVEPIEINSALVSAQNRKRLYWTNIQNVTQPKDKGILLKDIIHENNFSDKMVETFNINPSGKGQNGNVYCINNTKSPTLTTNKGEGIKISVPLDDYKVELTKDFIFSKSEKSNKVGFFRTDSQANRVYFINNKAITLCGDAGGGAAKMGQYLITFNLTEKEKNLINFEDNLVKIKQATKKGFIIANSFDSINFDFPASKTRRGRVSKQKANTLLANGMNQGVFIKIDNDLFFGYIRKLTRNECEILQTVPVNYTAAVSKAQAYKMLGNGWTVDVIVHILQPLVMEVAE